MRKSTLGRLGYAEEIDWGKVMGADDAIERDRQERLADERQKIKKAEIRGISLYNGIKKKETRRPASSTGLLIAGGIGVVLLAAFVVTTQKSKQAESKNKK